MLDYIRLYDNLDLFLEEIFNTEQYKQYIASYKKYEQNKEISEKANVLAKLTRKLENTVEEYGAYSFEYKEAYKEYSVQKITFDNIKEVAEYRYRERQLQILLDEITEQLAHNVSKDINVDRGAMLVVDINDKCSTCNVRVR